MAQPSPTEPSASTQGFANRFGLLEALIGFLAGEIFGAVLSVVIESAVGHKTTFGTDVGGLVGLWTGLVGAAIFAARAAFRGENRPRTLTLLADIYGLRFRLIDAPLGIAVGCLSSFLLVPLLELPLVPFVPHLNERLRGPANQLTSHINGTGYVALALLVCVATPFVEELFFRGLLLRALFGSLQRVAGRWALPSSLVICGALFGLAHFEALELLALSGFGVVLGVLALKTGRLGAGIFAHASFNAITIIALARTH